MAAAHRRHGAPGTGAEPQGDAEAGAPGAHGASGHGTGGALPLVAHEVQALLHLAVILGLYDLAAVVGLAAGFVVPRRTPS